MSAVATDTHALLWYVNNLPDLSAPALAAMDQAERTGHPIYVPSIVIVEIRYLVEKGRDITESDFQIVIAALKDVSSAITIAPLDLGIAELLEQIPRATVPDMPDRIIAATALALGVPVVTRDHKIQALTNITTIW